MFNRSCGSIPARTWDPVDLTLPQAMRLAAGGMNPEEGFKRRERLLFQCHTSNLRATVIVRAG
jgi:hypothetical protein